MKTQNTLENKARFFGNYLVQEIAFDKAGFKALVYDAIKPSWIESFYLELKPLSQISNEDTEHVMELENFIDGFLSDDILNYLIHLKKGKCNKIEVIDYLRSKGYALPWMDLSVEDLVEYGWVKLKEN